MMSIEVSRPSIVGDAEVARRLTLADGVISMVDGGLGDEPDRALAARVARGELSADAAVLASVARRGLEIATPGRFIARDFDDYLIPGTATLRNLLVDDEHALGIDDPEVFRALEVQISRIRLVEMAIRPVQGRLDYDHLKAIHKRLFGDVFAWAGSERVGPETPVVRFERASAGYAPGDELAPLTKYTFYPGPEIAEACSVLFAHLAHLIDNTSLSREERLERISECGELAAIHPFRDGNGRALLVYSLQFSERIGFPLDPADYLHQADVRNRMRHASAYYQTTGDHENLAEALVKTLAE